MHLRIAWAALLALLLAALPTATLAQRQDILDTSLVVRFLDAGDGEAVWMTTPSPYPEQRKTVLIDCGPSGFGGRLALQLQTANVTQIDTLLISGASDDVIGGCTDLMQQIPIGEIRWTGQRGNTPVWSAFESLVQNQQWTLVPLAAQPSQNVLSWGDVRGVVLNPPAQIDSSPDPDNSLVLEIDFAHWGILYAGDIHARGESQAAQWLDRNRASIQVLKVADHGSANGSSLPFLQSVFRTSSDGASRYAVVTNGGNPWSAHVEQPVLDNLRLAHVEVVNTADHGTITVVVQPDLGPHYVAER
jgi:beta-lactamase superfamily II metal-dependent hydrolase